MKKHLILFSILLSIGVQSNKAFAQTCEELKDSLFEIEYKLKTSQLIECSDEIKEKCRKPNDPDSQKTLFQAELDYNKALANVNMIESLIALSQAVEENHNALRQITYKELEQADSMIDSFMANFNKADLLSRSLNFVDKEKVGVNIWEGYEGSDIGELSGFLEDKCNQNKDYESFCTKFKSMIASEDYKSEDLLETLNNFAITDRKINYDKNERKTNYDHYKDYLKINIPGNASPVDLSQIETTDTVKKVLELQNKIKEYQASNNPETGKEILKLSKKLEKVDMNFTTGIDVSTSFAKNIEKSFKKDLSNASTVSGVFLNKDLVDKNLKSTADSMEMDIDNKKSILNKTLKDSPDLSNKCTDIKDINDCVLKLCNVQSYSQTCEGTQEDLSLGLSALYANAKDIKSAEILRDANKEMSLCMKKEDTQTRIQCLKETREKINNFVTSDLSTAKKELKKASKTLNSLQNGEPILRFRLQKLLNISTLEKNDCIKDKERNSTAKANSFCDTPDLDGHINSSLTLADDINKVLVTYDREKLTNLYNQMYGKSDKFEFWYEKIVKDCKNNTVPKYLCTSLEAEKNIQKQEKETQLAKAKEREQKEKKRIQELKEAYAFTYKEDTATMSGGGYAATGLAKGLVQGMPKIFSMISAKKSHDRQMNYYKDMYAYQSQMYSANTVHNTNWITWNYDSLNTTGFNNTGMNYLDTNNLNFGFSPIPFSYTSNNAQTYIPTGTLNTGTNTSTTTGTVTPFSFTP